VTSDWAAVCGSLPTATAAERVTRQRGRNCSQDVAAAWAANRLRCADLQISSPHQSADSDFRFVNTSMWRLE